MLEDERGGGLAVRAGDADHLQRAVGAAKETRRHRGHGAARVVDLDVSGAVGRDETRIFEHHRGGVPVAHLGNVLVAVVLLALPGEENIVLLDAARVVAQRVDDPVDRTLHRLGLGILENIGKFHSEDGLLALSAGAGVMGRSGTRFMICATCLAIEAKTGAETSAP